MVPITMGEEASESDVEPEAEHTEAEDSSDREETGERGESASWGRSSSLCSSLS